MKRFFLFSLILLICFSVNAYHYHGSEITCKQISGLTHQVTFKLYGDLMSGWQWYNNEILIIKNLSSNIDFNVNVIIVDTSILHNSVVGLVYSGIVTFPASGKYQITYTGCCRVNSLNVSGFGSEMYYNHLIVTVDTISGNSSPEFLNDPIVLAPVNDTLLYNPLPYDENGDDLLWSIDTPRMYDNLVVTNYFTPVDAGISFSISPKTGEIKWIPSTIGYFITAIKVEEFRNGIKIGEIVRDMIFIVEPKLGNLTRANIDSNTWPTDIYDNPIFNLTYNVPFNLVVVAGDPDSDTLSMEAKGYPFLLNNNPAVYTHASGPGFATGTFSWTPSFSDIKIDPHLVVFRIYEKGVNNLVLRDKTVQLMVGDFSTQTEVHETINNANIYPNPSTGELFISVNVEKSSDVKITFVNQLGQQVKRLNKKLNAGQNLVYLNDLGLRDGIYYVNFIIDGQIYNRKISIK